MRLQTLVSTSTQVASTSGRLAKITLLADLLKQAGDGIELAISYLSGEIRQSKVGVGWATVQGARGSGPGAKEATIEIGDVDATLERIAKTSGKGSGTAKKKLLGDLFARATAEEQDFLFRLLMGELRQGALEGLMVEALAKARDLPVSDLRRAAMLAGSLSAVATGDLASFQVELFRPIRPMLAQTANDVAEALERGSPLAFEYKLDGARIQVHKRGSEVRIYSRLLNEVTEGMPEVVKVVEDLKVGEVILDGEAMGLTADGRPLRFQETMKKFRGEAGVRPFFFDLLYLDGKSLLEQPYLTRVEALDELVSQRPPRLLTADGKQADSFFQKAIEAGHEGLMAKALNATYEPGSRGWDWIKIKRAHTLDLVVLAAEWGHGRRQGWLSNLHLGARDPNGGFVMLGKTFKGLTDALLEWQTKRLQEIEVKREGHIVHVRPELVVEIAFNGLQDSPHYPGGLALRFARVVRYREDKQPADADTIETVRKLHGA